MPQIIFEHSANLTNIDYKQLFTEIYQFMATIPNIGTCKIRAASQENYYIGTKNGENAFAFLRVLMKPKEERTDQFKENILNNLIPIVKKSVDAAKKTTGLICYPTVEVGELAKHYQWIED